MKLTAVPGHLVVALCVVSFLLGSIFTGSPPAPALDPAASGAINLANGGRKLAAAGAIDAKASRIAKAKRTSLLEAGELESLLINGSGLIEVRPPVAPAASGEDFYRVVPFQILSWYPRIVLFPNFLDKARCEHVIKLAKARMKPSDLAYRPGETPKANQDTRTSTGTFLDSRMDPSGVLKWIETKIAAATLIPVTHGEAYNVLRYVNHQHYDSHMDTFDPKDFGPQPSQRLATMLLYLSEVEEGGETVFKHEGKGGDKKPIYDWRNCEDGSFKAKPRQGDAILFYSLTHDGQIDPHALHGGCPVVKGEKWVATKWLHNKAFY